MPLGSCYNQWCSVGYILQPNICFVTEQNDYIRVSSRLPHQNQKRLLISFGQFDIKPSFLELIMYARNVPRSIRRSALLIAFTNMKFLFPCRPSK